MVRVLDSWLKSHGFESLQERRENFLLQGRLSVLTLVSVSVPTLCYRSSTYKIPVILPKVQWQVTAKHACTLRMWLCIKWHGAWLYGVHRTCTETAAVSCGPSHASAVTSVIIPLQWIKKKCAVKKLVTHVEPHASTVNLLKRGENSAIYI